MCMCIHVYVWFKRPAAGPDTYSNQKDVESVGGEESMVVLASAQPQGDQQQTVLPAAVQAAAGDNAVVAESDPSGT